MYDKYAEFAVKKACEILAIDSPTGYTGNAAEFVKNEFEAIGCKAFITEKGGVAVDIGGTDEKNALLLEAHLDTLGGMVAEIKGNGRLRITPLGGLNAFNTESENCRVITRKNGVFQLRYYFNLFNLDGFATTISFIPFSNGCSGSILIHTSSF